MKPPKKELEQYKQDLKKFAEYEVQVAKYQSDNRIEFYLLAIHWLENKIEYRRSHSYGHNERFFGSIDDIKMPTGVDVAWRNYKIDGLLNQ